MSLPSFFNVTPKTAPAAYPSNVQPPSWMSVTVPAAPTPVEDAATIKARMMAQFETILPRVLHMVCEGYTVSRAIRELPMNPPINYGMFNRWLRRHHKDAIEEAEEARSEVWADLIIEHAEGKGVAEHATIERSKFATDQYKFLMGRQSRKRYGDTKTVDVTHTISIADALAASRQRVQQVIDVSVIDDTLPDDEDEVRRLVSGDDDSD